MEDETITRAEALLAAADAEAKALVPPGAELIDVHTHVGTDIDGFVSRTPELLAFLARDGATHAFTFCLDEPDRVPAFRAANDRTLAAAAESDGVLVPFVRLDLADSPVEEAERVLDLGARGIKLHPRSQGFSLADGRLEPIFAIAAERGVPILIHGGRGLPPIAEHLHALAERHPAAQLIIAHAGIADLAGLAEAFGGRPGIFFDTSVWSALDLIDLYHRVSPEQVMYATDYPYGQQPGSLMLALRTARFCGFTDEQVRLMLGGSARRLMDGLPPAPLTPPRGPTTFSQGITYARIHHYLAMAIPLLWTRQQDQIGVLGLALNACGERNGDPETRLRIAELISAGHAVWRLAAEAEEREEIFRFTRMAFRLLHLADIEALTAGR
ncbi:MAG: amidohydrolase family protein [Thermoleophilia bacterium]